LAGAVENKGKILAALKERGLQPPDSLADESGDPGDYSLYWTAFRELLSERPPVKNARIPWGSIQAYAQHIGVEADHLGRITRALESRLREWWSAND